MAKKGIEYIYKSRDCSDLQDFAIAIRLTKELIDAYKHVGASTKALYKRLISLEKGYDKMKKKYD